MLEGLGAGELRDVCHKDAAEALQEVLLKEQKDMMRRQQEASAAAAGQENCKFSEESGAVAVFGKLEEFHGGLADKIGLPSARLRDAMEAEHCERDDSKEAFSPGNYDTTTTPAEEWKIVSNPSEGAKVSQGLRRVLDAGEVMQLPIAKQAGLRQEEVVALQLYTGPMF
mmetsp:Transcript_42056/g.101359  ORF Transcript_42056/g.101359 Transcript_42056/m.101359 type:complete len:169 (+) Transcript_42056:3-509(+)